MASTPKDAKKETANQPKEAFSMNAFEMDKMYETVREFSENGFKQQAELYEKLQTVAEDATQVTAETFELTKAAQENLAAKLVENTKSNMEAGAVFAEKLWGIRSVSEMIDFQSTYFRSQYETMAAQAKELQDLSTKTVENVAKPGRTFFEKSVA